MLCFLKFDLYNNSEERHYTARTFLMFLKTNMPKRQKRSFLSVKPIEKSDTLSYKLFLQQWFV